MLESLKKAWAELWKPEPAPPERLRVLAEQLQNNETPSDAAWRLGQPWTYEDDREWSRYYRKCDSCGVWIEGTRYRRCNGCAHLFGE